MTGFLYISILLNNIYFASKRKSNQILTIITLAFLFIVISSAGPFYSFHADYHNYYSNYYSVLERGILSNNQLGYSFIMIIGNLLGIPFDVFRVIVIAACLGILYKYVINRYKVNTNYVLGFYMIYAVIMDSEQFRNWIALTILLSGLRFLESSLWKDRLKFIFIWLISISFHYSFALYAPLLFVNGNKDNKLIKRLVTLVLMLSLAIILNGNQIPFQGLITSIGGGRIIESYLTTQTNLGFLIPSIMHGTSIILAYIARKIIYTKNELRDLNVLPNDVRYEEVMSFTRERQLANVIYWINISMLMVFPFYIINVQFYRLMRSLLLLTYLICGIASRYILRRKNYWIFNLIVLGSAFIWLYLDLIHRISPTRLLIPFFLENLL